jgi:hypothetical protein
MVRWILMSFYGESGVMKTAGAKCKSSFDQLELIYF